MKKVKKTKGTKRKHFYFFYLYRLSPPSLSVLYYSLRNNSFASFKLILKIKKIKKKIKEIPYDEEKFGLVVNCEALLWFPEEQLLSLHELVLQRRHFLDSTFLLNVEFPYFVKNIRCFFVFSPSSSSSSLYVMKMNFVLDWWKEFRLLSSKSKRTFSSLYYITKHI